MFAFCLVFWILRLKLFVVNHTIPLYCLISTMRNFSQTHLVSYALSSVYKKKKKTLIDFLFVCWFLRFSLDVELIPLAERTKLETALKHAAHRVRFLLRLNQVLLCFYLLFQFFVIIAHWLFIYLFCEYLVAQTQTFSCARYSCSLWRFSFLFRRSFGRLAFLLCRSHIWCRTICRISTKWLWPFGSRHVHIANVHAIRCSSIWSNRWRLAQCSRWDYLFIYFTKKIVFLFYSIFFEKTKCAQLKQTNKQTNKKVHWVTQVALKHCRNESNNWWIFLAFFVCFVFFSKK